MQRDDVKVRKVRRRDREAPPRPVAVPRCLCLQPPYPVATFVNGDLVSVVLRHYSRRDGCPMPPEPVDPDVYLGRP